MLEVQSNVKKIFEVKILQYNSVYYLRKLPFPYDRVTPLVLGNFFPIAIFPVTESKFTPRLVSRVVAHVPIAQYRQRRISRKAGVVLHASGSQSQTIFLVEAKIQAQPYLGKKFSKEISEINKNLVLESRYEVVETQNFVNSGEIDLIDPNTICH